MIARIRLRSHLRRYAMRSLSIRHKMILGLLGIAGILTPVYSALALYGMG